MTKREEERIAKARNLRYQKPMAKSINWVQILEDLSDIEEASGDIRWMTDDEEQLVDLMDGDEEQAFEFKMAFSDLSYDCERLRDELDDIQRYDFISGEDLDEDGAPLFDLFFPAVKMQDDYLGYDSFEGDYYPIDRYSADAGKNAARKKLIRLTKEQLLDLSGMALEIARSYMSMMYRYSCLKAGFDILRGENEELLRIVKSIDDVYEKWQDYQIVDIGLRMLTPRELFDAQGFPPNYIIDVDADGKVYPKSEQVARCGNAVCPPVPAALVRANLPEICRIDDDAA